MTEETNEQPPRDVSPGRFALALARNIDALRAEVERKTALATGLEEATLDILQRRANTLIEAYKSGEFEERYRRALSKHHPAGPLKEEHILATFLTLITAEYQEIRDTVTEEAERFRSEAIAAKMAIGIAQRAFTDLEEGTVSEDE